MIEVLYIVGHVGITLLAVAGLALRLEHRLTKIETDMTWLKNNAAACCEEEKGGKHAVPKAY